MPKSEWQELLGRSGVQSISRKDVIGQLASASGSGGGTVGSADLRVISGANVGSSGVSGALQGDSGDSSGEISSLTTQISNLTTAEQTQISATQANTQAVTQNTSSKSSGSSVAGQLGSAAESLFGGALSLSPILSGIASLFGGSSTSTPIAPFSLPPAVQNQAGLTAASGGQVSPVSYGQGGQPRSQTSAPATQVTVQVNAMDSQSFLDHSDDIAQAVKQALLNSNSLGDVIADL